MAPKYTHLPTPILSLILGGHVLLPSTFAIAHSQVKWHDANLLAMSPSDIRLQQVAIYYAKHKASYRGC